MKERERIFNTLKAFIVRQFKTKVPCRNSACKWEVLARKQNLADRCPELKDSVMILGIFT